MTHFNTGKEAGEDLGGKYSDDRFKENGPRESSCRENKQN